MTGYTPAPSPDPATLSPSLIRTLIPVLAGLLATWLLDKGIDLDGSMVGALTTAGLGYLYYAVARFLEVYASDKWGYILGIRRQPVYPPGTTPGQDDRGDADAATLCGALVVAGLIGLVISLVSDAERLVGLFAVLLVIGVLGYLFLSARRSRL